MKSTSVTHCIKRLLVMMSTENSPRIPNFLIPQKYAKRDLIYIQNGKETYMSARLIKAFREAGIKGIEFKAIGSLRFI